MPCLIAILMIAFPRVALVAAFFLTNILQRAYSTILIPVLGFFFLPLTTLVYAYVVVTHGSVEGIYLLMVIVSVLVDLGLLGGGYRSRRT